MKKWKRLTVLLLCLLFVQSPIMNLTLPVQAAAVVKTGLKKENGKYYFYNAKGEKIKNQWKSIKTNGVAYRYYFGSNGAAFMGTKTVPLLKKISGRYYAFNAMGRAVTNAWKNIKDASGVTYRYYFGSDGAAYMGTKNAPLLQMIKGEYYAFNAAGRAVTNAWKNIKGRLYFFGANGAAAFGPLNKRLTGVYVSRNTFYYFNKTGTYNAAVSKQLRQASQRNKPASALKNLLNRYAAGKPREEIYDGSCYGDGKDIIWEYSNFMVGVFRPRKGADIVVSIAAK